MERIPLNKAEAEKFKAACEIDDAGSAISVLTSAVARNADQKDCWVRLGIDISNNSTPILDDVLHFSVGKKGQFTFKAILNFIFEQAAFLQLEESLRMGRTASACMCLGLYVRTRLENDLALTPDLLRLELEPILLLILSRQENEQEIQNTANTLTRQIGDNLAELVKNAPSHKAHLGQKAFAEEETKELTKLLGATISDAAAEATEDKRKSSIRL